MATCQWPQVVWQGEAECQHADSLKPLNCPSDDAEPPTGCVALASVLGKALAARQVNSSRLSSALQQRSPLDRSMVNQKPFQHCKDAAQPQTVLKLETPTQHQKALTAGRGGGADKHKRAAWRRPNACLHLSYFPALLEGVRLLNSSARPGP